jgi:hypothetical protein
LKQTISVFFESHWRAVVVVGAFIGVCLVLYAVYASKAFNTWWNGVFASSSSASANSKKMVLPRTTGEVSVVASAKKSTSSSTSDPSSTSAPTSTSTKYYTKQKKPTVTAAAAVSPPRPDPNAVSPNDKEVFNISNNIYTYGDAPAVCKAFGSRLATADEVQQAFDQGAEWCNYGWTEDQLAMYPTQKATFDKLQTMEEHEHDCGVVGVNGGYFQNPDLQFGVNCYGKKPAPTMREKDLIGYFPDYVSEKEKRLEERVAQIKQNMGDLTITPFNSKLWDERRTVAERVDDWMSPG